MICTKKYYLDRGEARRATRRLRPVLRKKLRPYRCDRCGYWHLTSWKRGPADRQDAVT